MSQPAISRAEWEIMRILWHQAPLTARMVIDRIQASHDWSDSTIKTFIQRLIDKQYIHQDCSSRPYQLSPSVAEATTVNHHLADLFTQICPTQYGQAINALIQTHDLSKADCMALMHTIETKMTTAPDTLPCHCPPNHCLCPTNRNEVIP